MKSKLERLLPKPWLPYVLPFVLFLLLTEPARFFPALIPFLYIAKTFIVGALLWFWRHKYAADLFPRLSFAEVLTAVCCGLLVLVIWIVPEGYLFQLEQISVFDPYGLGQSQGAFIGLIAMRLIGAVVIVSVMEELFWPMALLILVWGFMLCSLVTGCSGKHRLTTEYTEHTEIKVKTV